MSRPSTAPAPRRQTADERRDAIIDAAITEFAQTGLHGTSTEAIARRAGISQPYVFRLFRTKKELFLAACARSMQRITDTFEAAAAAEDPPGAETSGPLPRMGRAYAELLGDREELLMQMQG